MPQCFSQPHHNTDASGSWSFCVDFCTKQNAVPAAIHSTAQNNWVSGHLGQSKSTWLGIKSIKNGIPNTWSDNTAIDYTRWFDGYPVNDNDKAQAIIAGPGDFFGYWKNELANGTNRCFCQKPSVRGAAEPPEYPDIPANELCETNWVYNTESLSCIYHDTNVKSWQAADGNCEALGGKLVSVNSPSANAQILKLVNTYFFDPTSIG